MSFTQLGLRSELTEAVKAKGYTEPSPIQAQAIPAILAGKDVIGGAQTGTGKTAAFGLPLLQILAESEFKTKRPRTLILAPTRELAAQVHQSIVDYGKRLNLKSAVIFGGVGFNPQITALRRGLDIIVATPGRLLDLCQRREANLSAIEILVLDEADRMLDMGFIHDIKKILNLLPKKTAKPALFRNLLPRGQKASGHHFVRTRRGRSRPSQCHCRPCGSRSFRSWAKVKTLNFILNDL